VIGELCDEVVVDRQNLAALNRDADREGAHRSMQIAPSSSSGGFGFGFGLRRGISTASEPWPARSRDAWRSPRAS
jgi:hypothetical protein